MPSSEFQPTMGREQTGSPCSQSTDYDQSSWLQLLDLPDDALFAIISKCDVRTLGQLACVCRRLRSLIEQDCVWVSIRQTFKAPVNVRKAFKVTSNVKYECAVAMNWKKAKFKEICLVHHATKQMPWVQLYNDHLWATYDQKIRCYPPTVNGVSSQYSKILDPGGKDVCRFSCKNGLLVSGTRDACLSTFNIETSERIQHLKHCHHSDVLCVDLYDTTVVSGCSDATVKMWNLHANDVVSACMKTMNVGCRNWSLVISPDGRFLLNGTAGWNGVPPLQVRDMDRGQFIGNLGNNYKNGAGVLDIYFHDPNVLFSCGYDTYVRMWDLRAPFSTCVSEWEEPFDYTVFTVRSDHHHSFVTGVSRHGMTSLWDIRQKKCIKHYYNSIKASSPVYSLAFESSRLYSGLDKGIWMVDFNSSTKKYNRRR